VSKEVSHKVRFWSGDIPNLYSIINSTGHESSAGRETAISEYPICRTKSDHLRARFGISNHGDYVEQACNIFYILHRILYFLPEVRGEGTCGGGREERSVNHIA